MDYQFRKWSVLSWGALAALLAAFLGLQDHHGAKKEGEDPSETVNRSNLTGLRAGSFGLACVAAILLGVFFRTHGVLSDEELSLKEQVDVWVKAGYDEKDALKYVAFQKLKILPREMVVTGGGEVTATEKSGMGVLFSGEGSLNYCHDLSFKGSVENTLAAYRATQNGKLIALADHIQQLGRADLQKYFLERIAQILCSLKEAADIIEYVPKKHQTNFNNALKEALCGLE